MAPQASLSLLVPHRFGMLEALLHLSEVYNDEAATCSPQQPLERGGLPRMDHSCHKTVEEKSLKWDLSNACRSPPWPLTLTSGGRLGGCPAGLGSPEEVADPEEQIHILRFCRCLFFDSTRQSGEKEKVCTGEVVRECVCVRTPRY